MPVFAWAWLGGALAIALEFSYRLGLSWRANFWWMVPLAVALNFALYQALKPPAPWLGTLVLFSAFTHTSRLLLAFVVLREPATPGSIIAAAALVGSALARLLIK